MSHMIVTGLGQKCLVVVGIQLAYFHILHICYMHISNKNPQIKWMDVRMMPGYY